MGNSFYVQLSPYLLLEYTYGDSSTTYLSSQVKLSRIKNAYNNGQCQLLNGSSSLNITQNVLNTSAANLGSSKWVLLDNNVPVPYINTDSNLTYTDMSSLLSSLYVTYDRVRVHIVSGYRLEDLQGLIVQIYGKEATSSQISVLANNVYLNSDDRDVLNPNPILLGDRMYDRYIEVFVPSLRDIVVDYYSNPTNPISIGYQYSSDNRGFLFNSQIYVKVYEILTTQRTNGILFLNTSNTYEVNLNQEDTYANLVANVEEATDGDYFMYYPTYAGNFILDFIEELNAAGGDYVIINDINIYEQVGLENLMTFSFSQVQTGGYDAPLTFRPILKYAGSAVAFSIDYTVRIHNRLNGYQIIRTASTTSFNPRKYGKQIDKISLTQQSFPFKVYNKIYGGSSVTYVGNEYSNSFSTVYVPVFYDSRNITVQSKTVLANGTNPVSPDFYNNVNFGQGDARIYLSDFESYHKFTVNQIDPKSGALTNIDLTSGNVAIAFKDLVGNTIKIPAESSNSLNSAAKGEVVFKIPDYIRKKILSSTSGIVSFYIVTESSGAPETLLYTGTVDNIENISSENSRVTSLISSSQATTVVAVGTTASTNSSGSLSTVETGSGNKVSLLKTLTDANSSSVSSTKSTPEVNPPVIPYYSSDGGASSVKGLGPVNNATGSTASSSVTTVLSQTNGTKTNIS
jgi:hypothetical protein